MRELQRGGADARADRVHEHPLAGLRRARVVTSASCAVTNASGTPPIVDEIEAVGHRRALRRRARATYSACAPPPAMPNTRAPTATPVTSAPNASTTPANSSPGMSAGDPGRRGVVAGALEQVGPVQPGAVHPDDHLGRRRGSGIGPVGDLDPAVGDRWPHCIGAGRLRPRPTAPDVPSPPWPAGSRFLDEDGQEVELDAGEADALLALTGGLDAATVSACPDCRCSRARRRSRSSTCSTPARRTRASGELIELADDAPTLHLYVVDLATDCRHAPLARPALRRVARRRSRATARRVRPLSARQPNASERRRTTSSTSRMNASTSVIAAGSMLSPRCSSSQ